MANRRLALIDLLQATETSTYTGSPIDLDDCTGFAIVSVVTDTTPSTSNFATTDVSVLNNAIVLNNHGMETGLKVRFTTTGTLPAGLSLATDYYVISTTLSTIRVATTLINSLAAVEIDITDIGVGTHTITPTASISPIQSLEATIDGDIYAPISNSSQTLSSVANLTEYQEPYYYKVRAVYNITSGQWVVNSKIMIRGQDI